MKFSDWYTDTVDIYRDVATLVGNLTRQERQPIATGVPCRLFHQSPKAISMEQTAAKVQQEEQLQCDNAVDIREGDELLIHRGAGLGVEQATIRAFAGAPFHYYEPFGAVIPELAHQEIRLLRQERVK